MVLQSEKKVSQNWKILPVSSTSCKSRVHWQHIDFNIPFFLLQRVETFAFTIFVTWHLIYSPQLQSEQKRGVYQNRINRVMWLELAVLLGFSEPKQFFL